MTRPLRKEPIFNMLSTSRSGRIAAYRKFVSEEDSEEITRIFTLRKLPSILGNREFVDWIKDVFFKEKTHPEVPEAQVLSPGADKIKEAVCASYGIKREQLYRSKRGEHNEPRSVSIYLTRRLRGEGLGKICDEYGLNRYSSASSIISKVSTRMKTDRGFRKRIDGLREDLFKHQT